MFYDTSLAVILKKKKKKSMEEVAQVQVILIWKIYKNENEVNKKKDTIIIQKVIKNSSVPSSSLLFSTKKRKYQT